MLFNDKQKFKLNKYIFEYKHLRKNPLNDYMDVYITCSYKEFITVNNAIKTDKELNKLKAKTDILYKTPSFQLSDVKSEIYHNNFLDKLKLLLKVLENFPYTCKVKFYFGSADGLSDLFNLILPMSELFGDRDVDMSEKYESSKEKDYLILENIDFPIQVKELEDIFKLMVRNPYNLDYYYSLINRINEKKEIFKSVNDFRNKMETL